MTQLTSMCFVCQWISSRNACLITKNSMKTRMTITCFQTPITCSIDALRTWIFTMTTKTIMWTTNFNRNFENCKKKQTNIHRIYYSQNLIVEHRHDEEEFFVVLDLVASLERRKIIPSFNMRVSIDICSRSTNEKCTHISSWSSRCLDISIMILSSITHERELVFVVFKLFLPIGQP